MTHENFYNATRLIFKACKTPKHPPDFISNSGSKYWYGQNKKGKYVIRQSDHWCKYQGLVKCDIKTSKSVKGCKQIASCKWKIIGRLDMSDSEYVTGKVYL
jgi:hypothetical protein